MTPIPEKLKRELAKDPYYRKCSRKNGECDGRITWEHAFIYAGKQIQEKWSIIPLCVYHHLGEGMRKDLNHWIALNRADLSDLTARMPKRNWRNLYSYLHSIYG